MRTFKDIILKDLKNRGLDKIVRRITSIHSECFGTTLNIKVKRMETEEMDAFRKVLKEYQSGATSPTERKAKFISLMIES
ncbi:MAG: hypothetical protein ABL927_13450 [Bdellovibrionales bacterium]